MEDRRTQHTLDALADLYLTGVPSDPVEVPPAHASAASSPPASEPAPPPAADAGPVPPMHQPAPPPAPRVTSTADHPLHGPPPFKLAPQPSARSDEPAPLEPVDPLSQGDFDALDREPLTPAETVALLGDEAATPSPMSFEPSMPPRDQPVATDSPMPHPAEPGAPQAVMTEAVVVGNLPGPSGAWVSQYAQSLAEHEGPVVLVHLDRHEIDLELVRPRNDAPEPREATPRRPLRPGHGTPDPAVAGADPIALLDAAVHNPDRPVQSVLVRIDPSTDIDDLARLADLDAWTLATGPDPIATAAAVQLIDRLLATYPEAADTALGLMVLGADQPAALEAANRVAAEVGPRLAHPVELLGYQKQMLPVRITQLGRATADAQTWTRLLDWLEQHAPADRDTDARPQPAPKPVPVAPPPPPGPPAIAVAPIAPPAPVEPPFTPEPTAPEPALPERPAATAPQPATFDTLESRRETIRRRWLDRIPPTPTRAAPPADSDADAPTLDPPAPAPFDEGTTQRVANSVDEPQAEPRVRRSTPPTAEPPAPPRKPRPRRVAPTTAAVAPPPTGRAEPARPAAPAFNDAPDLAALLADRDPAFAGAIALEARSPRHPDTELLLDPEGRLHLLARHDSTQAGAPELDATLVALLETRQWAIEHHALIALSQRQARFDRAAAPDIHLFTDDARAATRLADRVGPMLRLHLLQPVTIGRETTWFCTPLT